MKNFMTRVLAKVSILALAFSSLFALAPVHAATMDTRSDTMTRQGTSQESDHSIVYNLPTGIDFSNDGSGQDVLIHDFPAGWDVDNDTWVLGDFTFNDGTARTFVEIQQGAGLDESALTGACTDGANNLGIVIDTTGFIFYVAPCDTGYTASAGAATVTFTIDGTDSDGRIVNPAAASTNTLAISMDDEGSAAAHSGSILIPIIDDDTVTVLAVVAETLTFDLDTGTTSDTDCAYTACNGSTTTYEVDLGTLTTGAVSTSGDGTINQIGIDIASNATNGTVIDVRNENGANGLVSTSVSGDDIDVATDGTVTAGAEEYGICIHEVEVGAGTLRQASANTFGAATALTMDGDDSGTSEQAVSTTCDSSTHEVGTTNLTSTYQTMLNTNTGAIQAGRAEVFVKAAIDNNTAAHDDYNDTLYFRATSTF